MSEDVKHAARARLIGQIDAFKDRMVLDLLALPDDPRNVEALADAGRVMGYLDTIRKALSGPLPS